MVLTNAQLIISIFSTQGSRPSAMTLSDSHAMKMPPPIVRDMSCILVSKKRLIAVLGHLGFIDGSTDGQNLLDMIHSLWEEAHEYANGNLELTTTGSNESNYNAVGKREEDSNDTACMETDGEGDYASDLIQLGTLKWILYGFPAKQPSWFSTFCMPCGMTAPEKELQKRQDLKAQQEHPVTTSCMKRRHGELVRHDVTACKLCRNATGFSDFLDESGESGASSDTPSDTLEPSASIRQRTNSSYGVHAGPTFTDDESFVEVSTIASFMLGDMHSVETTEEDLRV
jgi:hypothetical protein